MRHFNEFKEPVAASAQELSQDRQTLLAILNAIAENRFNDVALYLAEDIEMDIHGFSLFNGSWSGKEDVLEALKRNFSRVTEQRPRIIDLVTNDGHIVARFEEGGRLTETRNHYAVRGIQWYKFRDGKLAYFEQYVQAVPVLPESTP